MMSGFTTALVTAQSNGPLLQNAAGDNSLLPPAAIYRLPPNYFQVIGQELIMEASGRITNNPGATISIRFDIFFAGLRIVVGPGISLNAIQKTDATWLLRWVFTMRRLGTVANFMHTGWFASEAVIGSPTPAVGGSGVLLLPSSAPAVSSNFNSTIENSVDLQVVFNAPTVAATMTLHQYRLLQPY